MSKTARKRVAKKQKRTSALALALMAHEKADMLLIDVETIQRQIEVIRSDAQTVRSVMSGQLVADLKTNVGEVSDLKGLVLLLSRKILQIEAEVRSGAPAGSAPSTAGTTPAAAPAS